MSVAIAAIILSGIGLLGGGLVMYTKIVQHLTRIETAVKHTGELAAYVPSLYYRVLTLEHEAGIVAPTVPKFVNGQAEE